MTDTELFEIVKGHREAWPEEVDYCHSLYSFEYATETTHILFAFEHSMMLFEASFHRALLARGDVYTHHIGGTYTVQTGDHDFTGGSLIEAYAKALEWLK